jgi:DNA (cytosine-5)-methyltransferase 1
VTVTARSTFYAEGLSRMWADAMAPREAGAPTLVSLFAGMGGSTIGYLAAGFRELLAVEWYHHAAACLRLNFPGTDVFAGDVSDLDPARLPLKCEELDVLDGSPPCQGFSSSGLRRSNDPRNRYWKEYVRLVATWRPRACVLENVPLIAQSRAFPLLHDSLRAAGYVTRSAVLDAGLFGCATTRKRFILIGVREDLAVAPTHPAPTYRPATLREAFAGLPETPIPTPPMPERFAGLARMIVPGSDGGAALRDRGGREAYWSVKRLDWDKPGRTLPATWRLHTQGIIHPSETRFLSVAELMRIQSVPDEYAWPERTSYREAHNRIGNCVPPMMMAAIGAHVRGLVT